MAESWRSIASLHESFPFPAAVTDETMQLLWGNPAALAAYPMLSLPQGLALLLGSQEVSMLQERLATVTTLTLPFSPAASIHIAAISEGYFLTILPIADAPTDGLFPENLSLLSAAITARLRIPLTKIFSGLSALSQSAAAAEDDELRQITTRMNESSYRMLRFTMDFSAYLQLVQGEVLPPLERLDLVALLQNLISATDVLTRSAGIYLQSELPAHRVEIRGDERQLTQAVLHLISNSCRYNRTGENISIRLTVRETAAQLTLTDHGCGIPAEILARVYEPFFSQSPFGEVGDADGLGLTIARHIIQRHGGTMAITSTPEIGTTVALQFPLAESSASLELKDPCSTADLLRDRFSPLHIILSDCCGVPLP